MKSSAAALFLLAPLLASAQTQLWGQCGGVNFQGSTSCVSGSYCRFQNDWYSQCVPGSDPNGGGNQQPTTTAQQPTPTPTPTSVNPGPTQTPVNPGPGNGDWVIPPATAGGLHEKMRVNKGRYFGTAFDASHLNNNNQMNIAKNEFGVVTHENSLKWETVQGSRGNFNFNNGDAVVRWAEQNNKLLRGHTLVWHSQLPQWVKDIRDAATLRQVIVTHITTVLNRYKGKFYHWDVVNEIFEEDGSFRRSVFYNLLGEEFVSLAFRTAREVDPKAKLYINDYNLDYEGAKLNAMIALVNKLRAQGVPIDGIGSQAHLIVGNGAVGAVPKTLGMLAATGAEVAITELDIRLRTPSDSSKLQQQARDYTTVINACLNLPKCVGVSVWGLDDGMSWVPYTFNGEGDALLWNSNFQKKPAYDAVSSALN